MKTALFSIGDSVLIHSEGYDSYEIVDDTNFYLVAYSSNGKGMVLSFPEPRLCKVSITTDSASPIIKQPTFMTNLIQTFKNYTKSEPTRSFLKAGVTGEDDALTPEGKDLFLAFLLSKHGDEFKKEVVDKILAMNNEEKKSK